MNFTLAFGGPGCFTKLRESCINDSRYLRVFLAPGEGFHGLRSPILIQHAEIAMFCYVWAICLLCFCYDLLCIPMFLTYMCCCDFAMILICFPMFSNIFQLFSYALLCFALCLLEISPGLDSEVNCLVCAEVSWTLHCVKHIPKT